VSNKMKGKNNMKTITSHDDLKNRLLDNDVFGFFVFYTLNKVHKNSLQDKEKLNLTIGDYELTFYRNNALFTLRHKSNIPDMIVADINGFYYIGTNKDAVIAALLAEFEKETRGE